jgi:iron complex outermembrane receptor protein
MMRREAIAIAITLAGWAGQAAADPGARYEIDVPPQPAFEALKAFAAQTRLQLVYYSELTEGIASPGVTGTLTAEDALRRLLSGTGLAFQFLNDRTVAIRTAAAAHDTGTQPGEAGNTTAAPLSGTDRLRIAQLAEGESRAADTADGNRDTSGKSPRPGLSESIVLPEVLVSGSKSLNMDIRRTRDDAQPYVIFEREKIEQSGSPNIESFLRDRLSMNANGLANGQRVTQLGNQSSFNLRGLGAGQTLILIDGHRLAPGAATGGAPFQADVNNIPLSAVERVEVLPATASGIYGGSATGGVINIILRRDYQGAEVVATYGNSLASDMATRRYDLATGINLEGGRTNILLISSYSDQNPLMLRERGALAERYYEIARANAPETLLPPNNPPLGSTPNIRSADGSNLVLKNGTPLNSSYTHIPAGYAGTSTDGGAALVANAGRYDYGLADSIQHITGAATQISQNPRNVSAQASVRREFAPGVQGFVDLSWAKARTSGPAVSLSGANLMPYSISASAPNNPFTQDLLVTVPTPSFAGDLGSDLRQLRAVGGVILSLPAAWQAEADYTWARTRFSQLGSEGVPGDDLLAVETGEADVLRDTVAFPVDLLSYQTIFPSQGVQRVLFDNVALRVAGPVPGFAAGPISVSTLLEYRKEEFPDSATEGQGFTFRFPSRSAAVRSAYVEAKIPLVSAQNRFTGVESLDVQLAARVDEYRTLGKTGFIFGDSNEPVVEARNKTRSVNPTIAVRYQSVPDVGLRLSYGTGFVAPDVSQLASSVSADPLTVVDPRRGNTTTVLGVGSVLQGGNAALEPESSENWSAGLIVTPRVLPGLRLSLDYTRIKKTDNIAHYPFGVQGLLNDEDLFPDRIVRGPALPGDPAGWAGPITRLDASLMNIASAEIEAFDMQVDYEWSTRLGDFHFSTVATRQTHYLTQSLVGEPMLENVGLSYSNPQEYSGSADLSWTHRGWTASWLARYYDGYLTQNPLFGTGASAILLQGNGGKVPSQTYHDVYVHWSAEQSLAAPGPILSGTEVRFGIRNLFDKTPPFDATVYEIFRTFHSPLADPVGTSYQITLTKRF